MLCRGALVEGGIWACSPAMTASMLVPTHVTGSIPPPPSHLNLLSGHDGVNAGAQAVHDGEVLSGKGAAEGGTLAIFQTCDPHIGCPGHTRWRGTV